MRILTTLLLCFYVQSALADLSKLKLLTVGPENRCSTYDKSEQYPYPQNVEDAVVASMGGVVYGPYSGRYFDNDRQTDIEHIVAASEGHDSGLCAASATQRIQFATDILNLTLASPEVNRCGNGGKCGSDAAEWLPERNKCWFAKRVVDVKLKYGLSIDQNDPNALKAVLEKCDSFDMIFYSATYDGDIPESNINNVLDLYDTNRNGRITCSEARAHGIAPVRSEHPAYGHMSDNDGDGVVCE